MKGGVIFKDELRKWVGCRGASLGPKQAGFGSR